MLGGCEHIAARCMVFEPPAKKMTRPAWRRALGSASRLCQAGGLEKLRGKLHSFANGPQFNQLFRDSPETSPDAANMVEAIQPSVERKRRSTYSPYGAS